MSFSHFEVSSVGVEFSGLLGESVAPLSTVFEGFCSVAAAIVGFVSTASISRFSRLAFLGIPSKIQSRNIVDEE